jgi:hypothetical protein
MRIMYIDSQNVHKAIEKLWWIIDREKFYKYSKLKFDVDEIKFFVWYLQQYQKFYNKLKNIWYDVVYKYAMILPDWTTKWNVDIDIAISSLVDFYENDLEKFYLVSSDWDYNTLVELMSKKWILWRVIIPSRQSASILLKKAAWSSIQSIQDLKFQLENK